VTVLPSHLRLDVGRTKELASDARENWRRTGDERCSNPDRRSASCSCAIIDDVSDIIDFGKNEFVHLGLGATTVPLPVHTGEMSWYEDYGRQHGTDGKEGRLVSMHTFDGSWDTWEMHPNGTELVMSVRGTLTLHQEHPDGSTTSVTLTDGQAIVNQPGVWHTADVAVGESVQALFITAGEGTQMRDR
jgi:mannose-6-phosphate isomerase-like protein (cupin superfamily)